MKELDLFAAEALNGLLSRCHYGNYETLSKEAFKIANAMLDARQKWLINHGDHYFRGVLGERIVSNSVVVPECDQKANTLTTEMLDLLQYFVDEDMLSHAGDELAIKLIKQATEL